MADTEWRQKQRAAEANPADSRAVQRFRSVAGRFAFSGNTGAAEALLSFLEGDDLFSFQQELVQATNPKPNKTVIRQIECPTVFSHRKYTDEEIKAHPHFAEQSGLGCFQEHQILIVVRLNIEIMQQMMKRLTFCHAVGQGWDWRISAQNPRLALCFSCLMQVKKDGKELQIPRAGQPGGQNICIQCNVTLSRGGVSVELLKITEETPKDAASQAWSDNVFYLGMSVFEVIYETGNVYAAVNALLPIENQECYLGYIAKQNRFVVGFDTWSAGDDCDACDDPDDGFFHSVGDTIQHTCREEGQLNSVFSFSLDKDGEIREVAVVPNMQPMFYPDNLLALHQQFPSLYDVRLD